MKKLLSMAVIFMMICLATTSCKKNNGTDPNTGGGEETITKNPIYDAFTMCKDFVGKDESAVVNSLKGNGFTYAADGGVYMLVNRSYAYQTSYKKNASGKIYDFSINTMAYSDTSKSGEYKAMMTGEYVKDAVHKIGETFTMSGMTVRFWRTYDNLMQPRAEKFADFDYVISSDRLHDTNTIWLEQSIDHYNAEDQSAFKGMMMKAQRITPSVTSAQEYSITLIFTDNTQSGN